MNVNFEISRADINYYFTIKLDGWMDDLAILCPFQQFFSHIRTIGG